MKNYRGFIGSILLIIIGAVFSTIFFHNRERPKEELNHSEMDQKARFRLIPNIRNHNVLKEDWNDFIQELPQNITSCGELFPKERYSEHFLRKQELFNQKVAEEIRITKDYEGNVGRYKGQARFYHHLANMGFVRNVCEIGFNLGHSAFLWIAGNQKTMLYSFDIVVHKYVRGMVAHFKAEYQDRFNIIYGDSTVTVPAFLKQKPYIKCDVLVVDGGHDYWLAKADLENMRHLANPERNIVIFDDFPSKDGNFNEVLGKAWAEMKAEGKIKELLRCMAGRSQHGFSVGHYIFE